MNRYIGIASLLMTIGFGAVAMEPAEKVLSRQEKKQAERRQKEEIRQQKKDAEKAKAWKKFQSERPAQLTQDVDMPRNLYPAPLAIRSRSGETVYYQNGQPLNQRMRRARKPRPDKLEEVVEQTEPEGTEGTDTAGYDDEIY